MDGVFQLSSGQLGPLEIELGNEVLESLRRLLEDVAVLHIRYGLDLADIKPLSVILELPNTRSEYYRLVGDIKKVTGLEFHTVTLGILISLMWQFATVDGLDNGLFLVEEQQNNLWNAMSKKWPTLARLRMPSGVYAPGREAG